MTSLQIIDLENIVRCEAQESYTTFYLADQSKFIMSKSLGTFERMLITHHFSGYTTSTWSISGISKNICAAKAATW